VLLDHRARESDYQVIFDHVEGEGFGPRLALQAVTTAFQGFVSIAIS